MTDGILAELASMALRLEELRPALRLEELQPEVQKLWTCASVAQVSNRNRNQEQMKRNLEACRMLIDSMKLSIAMIESDLKVQEAKERKA